jgi:predicted dehydrogenase
VALQAGFVGCGNITDTHARAAREAGVGVAAFHGRDLAKAKAMAERFGGRAFDDYAAFLKHRPMDLVVIGTPSALHAEEGIAAAAAGLHVLVEKPIDVTVEKGQALVAAAERAGV